MPPPSLCLQETRCFRLSFCGQGHLVNATREFKKGQPKNFIPQEGIRKIADAYNAAQDVDGFVKVITTEDAAKNDFNLSPSRYLLQSASANPRPVKVILAELKDLEKAEAALGRELTPLLAKLASMEMQKD